MEQIVFDLYRSMGRGFSYNLDKVGLHLGGGGGGGGGGERERGKHSLGGELHLGRGKLHIGREILELYQTLTTVKNTAYPLRVWLSWASSLAITMLL